MKKVYLISAPTSERRKAYPFSLIYLNSYLKRHGYPCEVLDCDALKWKMGDLLGYLENEKAEIAGITGYTHSRFYTYEAIKRIKSRLPGCRIILGGRHFTALARETLTCIEEADVVVRGEGEVALKEICDVLNGCGSFKDILGITYREGTSIVSNPDRPPVLDLEGLQYDIKDFAEIKGRHSFISTMRRFPQSRCFSITTGRGCPGRCVFCSLSSKRVRFRNVESVLDEIEALIGVTGVKNVAFVDPTLTASRRHIVSLCEGILRRGLGIRWSCYSRAGVQKEIFELMKRAGCVAVDLALESASPRVLRVMKKYIKPEDVLRCIKTLNRLKIKSFVYAMISLPDEREADAEMTLRFLEDTADLVEGSTLAITQVFPDAELYQMAKMRNILPSGFNWFDEYYNGYYDRNNIKSTAPFYIEHLSFDYILKMQGRFEKMALKKYYDRFTFKDEARRLLVPLIFDWKNQSPASKLRKIKRGIKRLPYILKARRVTKV